MLALTLITGLGAVQGGLVLLLILLRYRHAKNLPLALLLLVFSLRLATIPAWDEQILLSHPWIYPLTAPLPFLFGPLLWWYTRELGRATIARPRLLVLHALPYTFEVIMVTATLLMMSPDEYAVFLNMVFDGRPPAWLPVRNALKVAVNLLYVALAARIAFGPSSKRLSVARRAWIRGMVSASAAALASFAFVAVMPGVTARLADGGTGPFLLLAVCMAGLTYGISLLMIISPDISAQRDLVKPRSPDPPCSLEECARLALHVDRVLDNEAYRDPDLSLADLSALIGVHPNRLSYAINRTHGTSFRTVLNRRRIAHFITRIDEGALENRSILDIAFEAGFPSKSTFNRVFKESVGVAPSEYARNQESRHRIPSAPISKT